MDSKLARGLIVAAVALIIWFSPAPAGLTPQVWRLFAIFVATIMGFILQPLPISAVSILGLTIAGITGVLKPAEVLAGFGSPVIWLIFAAFLYAAGFIQTGLGQRIAYLFMRNLGDSTLKLAYAIILSDLMMSPATPSNTARAGGILFPIVLSVAESFDSRPGPTARRVGAYLMKTVFQADCITSSMFLTASASNPLVVLLAASTLGTEINWGLWALAAAVPGFVSLLATPYILYLIYPPEVTKTPEIKRQAEKALTSLGPMSAKEKTVAAIFLLSLVLWSTGAITRIDATMVAFLGVCLMLVTKVISWNDALEQKGAWDTMIWLGATISLADALNNYGFFKFAMGGSAVLAGIPWQAAFAILLLLFTYAHYGFAGNTPHVVAMYSAVGSLAIAAGTPPMMAALAFAFLNNLSSGITHYGNGPAVIYSGAGYVDQGTWMRLGAIVALINLVIWGGIGAIWWKVLGLW